jgi:hypothetical protein
MNKNDYAIFVTKGSAEKPGKPHLFKVTGQDKGIVTGILTKNSHIQTLKSSVEVPIKDVIINLGPEPYPGKVHGCDVTNLYSGKKEHPDFGYLYFMYKIDPEVGTKLFNAFTKAYKVLKQARLDFAIQPETCIWEIMPFHGEKYAGMYTRSKNVEKSPHRYQIRPEIMPANDWPYVIYHEVGHHLHKEFATGSKLQAAWIQLYNSTIKVSNIKREQSTEMLDALLAQEDRPSDFKGSLSEEDALIYKLILKSIQQNHSISVKELDLLFEADYRDDIRAVWPTRGISKKDLAPVVSEYALRAWYELFAESVAFRLSGKKLPKEVESLVDRTFSYARSNHEKRSA